MGFGINRIISEKCVCQGYAFSQVWGCKVELVKLQVKGMNGLRGVMYQR